MYKNLFALMINVNLVASVGEKAMRACKNYSDTMPECQNILHPANRQRVPMDLLLYPHMVLIGFRRNSQDEARWKCGGTLVSESWVLTAAHCSKDPVCGPPRVLRIGIATFEFDEYEDVTQERTVAYIVVHPGYKPPVKYNDIALVKTDHEFKLNRDIRIACLHVGNLSKDAKLSAIGFGVTRSGAMNGSKTLMAVIVDHVDRRACNISMRYLIRRSILPRGILESQICAGDYFYGGRDTCQGDSGGPMNYLNDKVDCVKTFPLHTVVGVTSFGRDCGRKMAPGVYTNVSSYIKWIEDIVWPG